ncbi:MAG: ABC transporter substrate-binding protein [Rhodospirillales bacterium]|nr:ABC transporter substrate-binding protein [Rhodospirillales bacterium]
MPSRTIQWLGACGIAGCLAWTAQPAQAAIGDNAQQPLVVAFKGGATTLDPIMRSETTTESWQRNIFDTITFQSAQGKAVPRIAVAWKNLSPLSWQLTLRAGVTFQNGTPMTADDVGQSIMDAANNPKSQMREFVNDVTGFTVVNPTTLDVTFKQPDPLFPLHLSSIPVMPEALIKQEGRTAFAAHPIGTGPYRFVSWLAEDHLNMAAWKGYWGKPVAFKFVRLESIPNGATRLAALLSGQIEIAEKINPEDFKRVKSSGRAYITSVSGTRTMYLAMDDWRATGSSGMAAGAKNPFLDPRVRKAVYEAIDVGLLRDKIFDGAATVASQFMPPLMEAYDPALKRFAYSLADAKKLLAEAGYPHGFTVRLDATNDRYLEDSLVAQALGGMLQEVGITVNVNAIPKAVFFPQMNRGDFTLYLAGWGSVDPLSTWNAMFHCRDPKLGFGHVNREHYCNKPADALIAKASGTFDDAARIKLEQQAYALADRQDIAYIPLYYQDEVAGVANGVVWQERPDGLILAWQMQSKPMAGK